MKLGDIEGSTGDGPLWMLAEVWASRFLVGVVTLAVTAVGVAFALLATPTYKATVTVMPVGRSQLGAGLGALSGLASLAGINMDSRDESQTALAVLKSNGFISGFVERHGLTEVLAAKSGSAGSLAGGISTGAQALDIRDAVRVFGEQVRRISEDSKSGTVSLSITWHDPETAAVWANSMVAELNERMRSQAERSAQRNVEYLQRQIATATVPALQQSLSKVLEGEMQTLLLAHGNEEYAMKVVDVATAPKYRESPKRTLDVLGSFAAGLLLSLGLIFGRKGLPGLLGQRGAAAVSRS